MNPDAEPNVFQKINRTMAFCAGVMVGFLLTLAFLFAVISLAFPNKP